jgi:flagellar biosynthesis protein FliR
VAARGHSWIWIVVTLVLALRGATAIVVATVLVGGIPRVVSVALAATLGLWSALIVSPLSLVDGSIAVAAHEIIVGATLGVMAAVPLVAAATAGRLVDIAATGRAQGPYASLFGVLAAAVFVGIDGHVAVVAAIVDSHRTAPAETSVLASVAALIPAAVRLAVPWLVTAAVVEVGVGAGVRVAGRAGMQAPIGAAAPAALVMITAALVGALAIAMAAVFRG